MDADQRQDVESTVRQAIWHVAYGLDKSRMRVESIRTTPSSRISVGALTTGLICWNCSKWRNTETDSCSRSMPRRLAEIATRRT